MRALIRLAGLGMALVACCAHAQDIHLAAPTDFAHRAHLLGELGGERAELELKGFHYDVSYGFDLLWNVSGGVRTGHAYRGDLSITLDLETGPAGLWDNGHFSLRLQGEHGEGLSGKYTGDAQALSNIDADDFAQISDFYYEHFLLDGKLRLKAGKMDANSEFAVLDYGGNFIHSSAGHSPNIPLPTFPDPDLAVLVAWQATDWLGLKAGIMNSRANAKRPLSEVISEFRGPMFMFEPEIKYTLRTHPGTLRPGLWYSGETFDLVGAPGEDPEGADPFAQLELFQAARADGVGRTLAASLFGAVKERVTDSIVGKLLPVKTTQNDALGFYVNWDQEVYRENPELEEDHQGIGVFAQGGWASGHTNLFSHYFGTGLEWTGAIPSRDDDVVGLGIFHGVFSPESNDSRGTETAVELFYHVQVTPWISIKPIIDYIANPGGAGNRDAWVMGFRSQITF